MTDALQIEQVDREAAALCAERMQGIPFDGNDVAAMRIGIWDDGELGDMVQAFARHRLAALAPQSPSLEDVRFLIDRLNELDWSQSKAGIERDWHGHVVPALSRLSKEVRS